MKISVIIPSFKPKEYLWECLRSMVLQDFSKKEFEILIILNGCCEPYLSNIKDFITTEMIGYNVSVFQTDECGVSNARNIGMKNSKGEWLAFIDDDDKISSSYLTALYKVSSPQTISISNVKCVDESNGTLFDDYLSKSFLKNQWKQNMRLFEIRSFMSTCCCKLIPTQMIQNRKFDTRFTNAEDSLFMFLISNKVQKFALADPDAIYYRNVRQDSASRNKTKAFLLKNKVKVCLQFILIYLSSPFKYNFLFFISRIVAVILR